MKTIQKLFILVMAGLSATLSMQAQTPVSGSNDDVGEIPIKYALSQSGAVTYQVPADIHPDPEHFQPELSFGYNSQQSEGALGYGWNINGLSSITHTPGSIYYDGKATPLSVAGDKLMLDGIRLINIGADKWQSEQGFIKVNKLADQTLKVRYPDGNTAMFETSPQAPFSYMLTNYVNRKGRTIKYVYTQAGNLSYIRKIMYGGNSGMYNDSIVFNYKEVTDGIKKFTDGKAVKQSKLLEKVESYYRGKLWRRYLFTYEKQEVSQLVRIDCETESRTLRPLQFKYGDGRSIEFFQKNEILLGRHFKNMVSGENSHKQLVLSRGRFNKDTSNDGLISYPQYNTYHPTEYKGDITYSSSYSETQELLVYKDLSAIKLVPVSFTTGKGFQQLAAADVDGSGVDVLVKINYNLVSNKEQLVVAVYNQSMNPTIHNDYTYESNTRVTDGDLTSPRQREFLFGDFNGDGKTELLAISSSRNHTNDSKNEIPSHALLVDLQNRRTLFDGNCFAYTFFQKNGQSMNNASPDRLIAIDYNGDGKTDICLINADGIYVYEFTGDGFKQLAFSPKSQSFDAAIFNFNDRELMVADMNGDGNMDLILGPPDSNCREAKKHLGDGICHSACNDENNLVETLPDGSKRYRDPQSRRECLVNPNITDRAVITSDKGKRWTFVQSTGNSEYKDTSRGFEISSYELFHCFFETVGQNFMLVDVDNDGLPDLLRNVRGKVDVYLNKNGKISDTPNIRATQQINTNSQFAIANVSQSYFWAGGLICVDNGMAYTYNYTREENKERMLQKVTDSYGIKTEHYYTDILRTNNTRYEIKNGYGLGYFRYPYSLMTPHYYVGLWAKKYDGFTLISSADYKYVNATFHRTGLGFRGFQQIETTDYINNRKEVSTFDPTLLGAEASKETPTGKVTRNYTLLVNSNKTSLLMLDKEVMKDKLNNTETTGQYSYNEYGQVIRAIVAKGPHGSKETISDYLNVNNENTYLLGLPTGSETLNNRNDSIQIQATGITYDNRYLPIQKTTFIDSNITSEERFAYDENQRLIKHEKRPYEATGWLADTYTYDTMGRLAREIDAMGLYTNYTYDEETGLTQSSTDHKGRISWNEYDEWGNLTAVHYPDGRTKQTHAAWCTGSEPGTYVLTTTETGKPAFKTYYDRMRREIRNSQVRFDGREMKTDKAYHAKTGLLERTSQPTTDEQPSHWNRYTYDEYDRQTSIRYASGKIDSCAYGELTRTLIENGISHEQKLDETGLLIQATDAAGSIAYHYRPDGQPSIVIAPGNVQTRFYYDKYGRRTAIKDPSAGIRRTAYDADGNVCKETDADGKEILKTYDNYGRIVSQTTPDIHTTYTYDDTENLLVSAISDNGTAVRYTYDSYGRINTLREEAPDAKWLEKKYAYTTDGLVASISYSSAEGLLTTEQMEYANGYLYKVRLDNGTLVYRHDEENALGQLTKLTTGTMQRTYEFNAWGLPSKRSITDRNGNVIFNHSYSFNPENNTLQSRKDETRELTETFGYDHLNRLETYGNHQVVYDNNGNILSKSDAGTLAYTNPNRPYAVTRLEPEPDNSKQVVTGLDITYTAAQRPSIIKQGSNQALLTYNANHDRIRMQLSNNGITKLTRYYLGNNYEQDSDDTGIQERLYLGGGYYDAPAVLIKKSGQTGVYYIHRDYLGSILQIAGIQGNVVEENSFDAWGCRRNPVSQLAYASNAVPPALMLGRGFTGHEHLDMFGLVNMNARLYDPILGRFVSPDPYVQTTDFTQAFNRYSYCMNSPLCYVDENGELWWLIGGALIGAYIGASLKSHSPNPAHWNNDWWKGALIGAAAGAATGAMIGAMWAAGATISFGVSGSSFYLPILTFTPATATIGGITTATIGGGLGLWSGISIPLSQKNKEGDVSNSTSAQDQEVIDMINKWNKDKNDKKDGAFNHLDYTGFALSQSSITVYSEQTGKWMGKNGRLYNFNFNGNQYTGGKLNFAKSLATKLDYAAKGAGVINIGMSWNEYRKGNLSLSQAIMDTSFGAYSILDKRYGSIVGIFYNLGKEYGPIHKYIEKKNNYKY